ncbi:MAG: hypothetical protein BWX63_01514 [Bacteroidetes bacterium ADurb.Bin041]|nr:MAG: hypothetical protein BWX63_01514 [Bacteroidetes bacterium ADurb.Bin041]
MFDSTRLKMEKVIAFLSALKENNNRSWFEANKDWYLESRHEFMQLTGEIIKQIALFDPSIGLLTAKDCVFRIYRDVRFSHDKSPYKTNMGAYLSRGDKKSRYAGYYLHLEPDASMAAGGKWMPQANELKLIRLEIFNYPAEFISILNNIEFRKRFTLQVNEKLKKSPLNFPAEFEHVELIKYKSYTVSLSIPDEITLKDELISTVVEAFRAMSPFINFLNRALDEI